MPSLHGPSIPMHRNPSLRPGLAALVQWLKDSEYSAHAIGCITRYVATQGTPTGAPCLEPADEGPATAVFCDGLDAVPYSSDAWLNPSVFLDVESLLKPPRGLSASVLDQSDPEFVLEMARHFEPPERDPLGPGPILLGPDDGGPDPGRTGWSDGDYFLPDDAPEPPDAPDAGMSRSAALGELLRNGRVDALPPIAGGSPDFEPSAEDLADYQEWSADLDRRRSEEEALDRMRAWYAANEHTRPDYDPAV